MKKLIGLGAVVGVVALATFYVAERVVRHEAEAPAAAAVSTRTNAAGRSHSPARARSAVTPGAAEFGRLLVETSNAYAAEHGVAARLAHPDCVQASTGHYMCSYLLERPGRPRECHLVQADWTPERASTFTVTLGGRVRTCRTLREALRSLP